MKSFSFVFCENNLSELEKGVLTEISIEAMISRIVNSRRGDIVDDDGIISGVLRFKIMSHFTPSRCGKKDVGLVEPRYQFSVSFIV